MKCYEFWGCENKHCSIFNIPGEKKCWEVKRAEKTSSLSVLHLGHSDRPVCCEKCLYYEYKNKPHVNTLKEMLVKLISL